MGDHTFGLDYYCTRCGISMREAVESQVMIGCKETCISIPIKYCTYEIWPESHSVRTVFRDGLSCAAMRDENDPVNIKEARLGQGYTGPDAVWRSLVDHELLHSLACEVIFDRMSYVLREQAGDETFVSARDKYEEEALVLDLQYYINTGKYRCMDMFVGSRFGDIKNLRDKFLRSLV